MASLQIEYPFQAISTESLVLITDCSPSTNPDGNTRGERPLIGEDIIMSHHNSKSKYDLPLSNNSAVIGVIGMKLIK